MKNVYPFIFGIGTLPRSLDSETIKRASILLVADRVHKYGNTFTIIIFTLARIAKRCSISFLQAKKLSLKYINEVQTYIGNIMRVHFLWVKFENSLYFLYIFNKQNLNEWSLKISTSVRGLSTNDSCGVFQGVKYACNNMYLYNYARVNIRWETKVLKKCNSAWFRMACGNEQTSQNMIRICHIRI